MMSLIKVEMCAWVTPTIGPRWCSDTNVIEERGMKGETRGEATEGWGRRERKGEKKNLRENEMVLEMRGEGSRQEE